MKRPRQRQRGTTNRQVDGYGTLKHEARRNAGVVREFLR